MLEAGVAHESKVDPVTNKIERLATRIKAWKI